jgi:hypothetical protein
LGYEFTKYIRAGIGLIIGGFLFTLGQNLYDLGKQAVIFLPLQFAIPTALTAAGLGLIFYDFWSRRKKTKERIIHKQQRQEQQRKDEEEKRRKSERDWKYFPSNTE